MSDYEVYISSGAELGLDGWWAVVVRQNDSVVVQRTSKAIPSRDPEIVENVLRADIEAVKRWLRNRSAHQIGWGGPPDRFGGWTHSTWRRADAA
jgi:hypothetical protein